jgi:hypothetical protein
MVLYMYHLQLCIFIYAFWYMHRPASLSAGQQHVAASAPGAAASRWTSAAAVARCPSVSTRRWTLAAGAAARCPSTTARRWTSVAGAARCPSAAARRWTLDECPGAAFGPARRWMSVTGAASCPWTPGVRC